MCGSKPKAPPAGPQERPAVLLTARDGISDSEVGAQGRRKMRMDLNNATTPYGSSLVIPT